MIAISKKYLFKLNKISICLCIYSLLWAPLYPTISLAAASTNVSKTTESVTNCPNLSDQPSATITEDQESEGDTNTPPFDYIGVDDLKQTPTLNFMLDQRISTLITLGTLDQASGKYKVCNTNGDTDKILSVLPINTPTKTLFNALGINTPKISFKNPQDKWALTGEPCRKYLSSGT